MRGNTRGASLSLFGILVLSVLLLAPFVAGAASDSQGRKPVSSASGAEASRPTQPGGSGVLNQLKEISDQVPTPIKTEQLDRAGEKIGLKIGKFEQWAAPIFGGWINQEVLRGVTWFKMLACVALFLLVLVTERAVRLGINRWLQRKAGMSGPVSWSTLFVRGVSKPLSLFLWAYGAYGAISPLFSRVANRGIPQEAYRWIKWGTDLVGSVAALWFLYRMLHLVDYQANSWARGQDHQLAKCVLALSRRYRSPVKFLILLIFSRMVTPLFGLPDSVEDVLGQGFGLLLIASIAWLTIQTLGGLEEVFLSRYPLDVADNLQARKMHTQVRFLKRMGIVLVVVISGASMLMLFDRVRQLGTSILASAGIAGIVVGLAAQRSITNILVGLQLALTQPIRLDDVVIVEKEWGRVEEITTTYVVVKLWDLRRLIVPTTYFTEKPFQNWTRVSSELLGTVFLYTDYTVPVEAVREELARVLARSRWWNGKVGSVQVTDSNPQGMQVRLVVSADDASATWDLRCEVREKMIAFLQERFPQSLPRIRADLRNGEPESANDDVSG
ncbi:hypothetical protein JCM15519_36990 [Fundidesulfovibrio butyratiphilus]